MSNTSVSVSDDAHRVSVEGEVDITNLHLLKTPVERFLDVDPIDYDITFDFTRTTYIDSAVLELIIITRNKLAKAGKSLKIVTRRKTQPDSVLRMCRFDTILDLLSDETSEGQANPTEVLAVKPTA